MKAVTIHTDPNCPWAWRTALWLREVQRLGEIVVTWKLFSLVEVNRDRDVVTEPMPAPDAHRLLVQARRDKGEQGFDDLYVALGTARFDDRGDLKDPTVLAGAVSKAGFPAELMQRALSDQSTADEVQKEHIDVVERYDAFGVPWLIVDSSPFGFYGPIISDVPTNNGALELWNHTAWLFTQRNFFEMKRPR